MVSSRQHLLFAVLLGSIFISKCCSDCRRSSNLDEKIQDWFRQLGSISKSIEQECSLLPNAGSLSQLESRIDALEHRQNTSFKICKTENAKIKAEVTILQGRLKLVEDSLKKLISQSDGCRSLFANSKSLTSKVPYGVIKCSGFKNGDSCSITCDNGSYRSGPASVSCSEGSWETAFPTCKPAHSCMDFSKYKDDLKSGVYKLWSETDDSQYEAYCDLETDNGGWTLVAVVANDNQNSWTYSDSDKDYGDLSSLWENALTIGDLTDKTPTSASDYKGKSFMSVNAKEVLITLKGKPYIQTDSNCLGGKSLRSLLNVYRFSCGGSSYNCFYGKCLGVGGNGVSSTCHHGCKVVKFYSKSAIAGEPLANGKPPLILYIKSGEAEKAQDGNKDRVYFSTSPFRDNVDYTNGLGAFTGLNRKLHTVDISTRVDVAASPTDKTLYYGIYVR